MLLLTSATLLLTTCGYAVLCAVQPFVPCRKCGGTGTRTVRRNRIKLCRRCHGTRYRLRIGRRIHNHSRRIHADGTRPNHRPAGPRPAPWKDPAA